MVIKGKGESLLGKETDTKLGALNTGVNIATISDVASRIQEQYPVLFRGLGKLNTRQIGLYIDEAVTPEAQPNLILFERGSRTENSAASRAGHH